MNGRDKTPRNLRALTIAIGAASLLGALAAQAGEGTRALHQTFPSGGEIRLANLAGKVELAAGTGREIVVDATIHAEGSGAAETQSLLNGMSWAQERDKKGRPQWVLTYPVNKYRSFAYPRLAQKDEEELPWFLSFLENVGQTSSQYRGERVKIYSKRRSSAPTLYADLRITLPAGANLAVRNVVGPVRGGALEGILDIDTGSGKVELASHIGQLTIDTGSGDVIVGSVKGETSIDTGSGDVVVSRWIGNGMVDTGSGNVVVRQVSGGKISLDTGSGDVTVEGGVVGKILADTGSGNVKVVGVELEELDADTGSGDVTVKSPLAKARRIHADTGSGDVTISGGPEATFAITADQGSGDLIVGYADATLRKDGHKVVGATRGDARTAILCETGSGDCEIRPNTL
jgi:DUF4097 and DUF4098 domain-containing protein YvlB